MIMKTRQQFISDTLTPYFEHPETRATAARSAPHEGILRCVYQTDDGRKCAFGQHMSAEALIKFKDFNGDVECFHKKGVELLSEILTEEANAQELTVQQWISIQKVHDFYGTSTLERIIFCENCCDVDLSHLKEFEVKKI